MTIPRLLSCHLGTAGAQPCRIEARVTRGDASLALNFLLEGDLARLRIPPLAFHCAGDVRAGDGRSSADAGWIESLTAVAIAFDFPPQMISAILRSAQRLSQSMHITRRLGKVLVQIGKRLGSEHDEAPAFHHDWISAGNKLYLELISKEGHGYAWGVLQGARLASGLGYEQVSVIEFGVAAGNGLLALERFSTKVEGMLDVKIEVHGFDNLIGLPKPKDYRDIPYTFSEGSFMMDEAALRTRLKRAQLHLGLINETLPRFLASNPAPVAFVSFDLDYYSSTMEALRLLDADERFMLPRIQCYFDDIFECGDHDGERLAIADFNAGHSSRKISPIHALKYHVPSRVANPGSKWEKYHLAYLFDHSRYGETPRNWRVTESKLD